MPELIKAKSVHDIMPEEEVTLENVLLGIEVDDESIIMAIGKTGNENDNEDVDEEAEQEEMLHFNLAL